MERERYTITILPSSGRRMKSFSLSRGRVLFALVSFVLSILLALTVGSIATWRYCRRQKRRTIEAVQKYEALNKELQDIRKSYWDFRSVLGIESPESEGEPGRGGPESLELEIPGADPLSFEDMSESVIIELKPVLEEAVALKADFEELTNIAQNTYEELGKIPSIWPIRVEYGTEPWVSSRFGWRRSPFTRAWEMHEGIDITGPQGTPLISTADGIIEKIARDRYLGNYVVVYHGDKFSTRYGHMNSFVEGMKEGDEVRRGDIIGFMGRTGRTTGCHVHYEVLVYGKRINPANYILN